MNVGNTIRPIIGQPNGLSGQASPVGNPDGAFPSAADRSLTVQSAGKDLSTEAAKPIDPLREAEAVATDRLDALIKSVLDYPPPPMPDFGD